MDTPADSTRRYCWECQRRRLECDSTRPVCNKCRQAGVVCPGYEDKKPLRWLAPGKVTSRNRKRKTPVIKEKKKDEDSAVSLQAQIDAALERAVHMSAELYKGSLIPVVHLRDDVSEAVQSACYCKSNPFLELTTPPYINPIPLEIMRLFPGPIRRTYICLALGHYLHQTRPPKAERVELWCRFHTEKGLSLHDISEEIVLEKDIQGLDQTVISIMCLMLVDLSYGSPRNWRVHFLAAMKALACRGGIKKLHARNPTMQPTLKYFMILGVVASSTSPPEDYLVTTPELDFLEKVYGKGDYPTVLCPPFLFMIISQINRLRLQTTQPPELHEPDSPSPQDLLSKILSFDPDAWASLYTESYQQLFLIARIYHSAVALYCISALRNLFPIGFLYNLLMLRAAHADCLFGLLREAILSPQTNLCLMWPLNVAGVEAATRSLSDRLFVEEALDELSRGLGTGYPLVACSAIQKLWDSGKTEWDDCYDRPYAFLS
ncbi:C6 zinc finger domain protein [Apiospora rasikravindrae]|uniref:C6 zinc finger domain protein n=1 Tax=Apiospora rasikravindrae TaxID=990691 RepID=A0ABR1SJR5_9PEZI